MKQFRIILFFVLTITLVYTIVVGNGHGWDLMPIFFGDIRSLNWSGQFNLDFLFHLCISATWVLYRNKFSLKGTILAIFALIGGIIFLSIYLMYLTFKCNNAKELLLGDNIRINN